MAGSSDSFAAPLFETSGPNQFKTSLQGVATAATAIGTAFQGVSKSITASIAAMGTQLDQLTAKMGKIGAGGGAGGSAGFTPGTTAGWGEPASAASALGSSGVGGNPGNVRGNGGQTSSSGGRFRSMLNSAMSGFSGGGDGGMGGGVSNGGSSFSGSRLAVGVGVAAAGATSRYTQNASSAGTTWRQLEFNVQSSMGGSLNAAQKYASQFTGWGGSPGTLNTAIQNLQGVAGYGVGSKGFTSMMNSAGALSMISQANGGGLTLADTSATQANLMSSWGRSMLGSMGFAQLAPKNTNMFSVAELVSQQVGKGKMLNSQQLSANSGYATGLYNTLGNMGFNTQTIQAQISYLQRQQSTAGPNGSLTTLGVGGMTSAQEASAMKKLGYSQTDINKQIATSEQKSRNTSGIDQGAADSSTAMNQAATNFLSGVQQFQAVTTALGQALGVSGGVGGLLGGGSLFGQAGGSLLGNLAANKLGGKLLKGGGSTGAASATEAAGASTGAAATLEGSGFGAEAVAGGAVAPAIGGLIVGGYLSKKINYALPNHGQGQFGWSKAVDRWVEHTAPRAVGHGIKSAWDSIFGGGGSSRNSRGGQAGNAGASPGTTTATSAPSAAGNGSSILGDAEKYLGVPYRWGGTNPATGLDCSGLTQLAAKDAGIAIPRTSQEQNKVGTAVPNIGAARAGDLVFYPGSDGTAQNPGHVGIYAGNGKMIDAPYAGQNVRFDSVGNPTSIRRISGGLGVSGSSNNNGGVGGGAYVGNTPAAGLATVGVGEGTTLSESAILGAAAIPTFMSAPSGIPSTGNGGSQGNATGNGGSSGSVNVGAVGSINNTSDFAKALLGALGDPTTPANIASIVAWENREGGNWHNSAKYNPLNTTQKEPGSGMTGTQGDIGVYTSWAQGVLATAQTLTNGRYNDIDAALKQGIGLGTKHYASLGVWSGGGYTSLDSGTQQVGSNGLYQLHANEMVIRPGAAAAMRMNQMSGGSGPGVLINFEKGSIVYSPAGSSSKSSTPQQDGKAMADSLINEMEHRLSMHRIRTS